MEALNLETLLGENIEKAEFLGIASNDLDNDIYIISRPIVSFLEIPISNIVISTGINQEIIYIHIILAGQENKNLHTSICHKYGENYEVMVLDKMLSTDSKKI
tara:strand:- start:849 stop:1157 length:309 start_codon:yes stop_codon:yes gene_type:complete